MRILAIDLGTSAVKLMRLDEKGRVLATDRAPARGIDIAAWLDAIARNIGDHGDGDGITALSLTGQMHGLVTRTDDGSPGITIPWHDARSASLLPALEKVIGPEAPLIIGGPIAPGFMAASLAWVRERDPEHWSRIACVSLPKDALVHALTGAHITDPTDAAGSGLLDGAAGTWARSIVEALGIPREWLPGIVPSGSIAGTLTPAAARRTGLPEGIPVIVAGGDAPVGAFGSGVVQEGETLVMLSTGAQVIHPSRTYTPDPSGRWYTWPSAAPVADHHAPFLKIGTLMNAGNVSAWAESVLAQAVVDSTPTGLIALPHLIGTREDPALSGAIVGLTPHTSAGTIRHALMEGVAFSLRARLDDMAGDEHPRPRLRIGGGLAHRRDVLQLFADVLGGAVESVEQEEATAYGAGRLALHALGVDVPDRSATGEVIGPIARHTRTYEALYALYRELDAAIAPVAKRLTAIEGGDRA